MRKMMNGMIGLGLGLVTLPLAFVIWPAFCMWFCYNETDEGEGGEDEG